MTNPQPIQHPIRNDAEHATALREIEALMDAVPGTPEGDRLDLLATLVEAYEAQRWPIENPDPIAAILFMMEQKGLDRRDLVPAIGGGTGRVSEILNRQRPLTLPMIRALAKLLELPADVLVQEYPLDRTPVRDRTAA
jgi:HTH-type transcriptional regulator/antitoxin HigA